MAVFEPPAVNGVFPPGLRAILLARFLPTHTASDQERLRQTLTQESKESVQEFYDRVESVQFMLDMELPEDFRQNSKASYDIVHDRLLRGNFIAGLKKDINTHVQLSNVATTEQALSVAVAFEKANTTTKTGSMCGAAKDEMSIEARIAALELQKQQRDGNERQGNSGKLADEGCFYCGFIGHIKKVCRIKSYDESMGVFRQRAEGYQPGRVGKRGGQRGGGSQRGGYQSQRGGYNKGSYNRGGYTSRGGRGNQRGFHNRGGGYNGGYAHAYGQGETTLPPHLFPPHPANGGPVVPMPGWTPMGFPPGQPSQGSSPSIDMSQYFGPTLGSVRFNPEN